MTTFSDFLRWEAHSRDTIDFKKIYVDMAGDLNAGLMLSEIVYWYLPSKDGSEHKMRVEKKGQNWIAVHRYEWWDRIRLSPDQSDRALNLLVKSGLVTKTCFKFAGQVTIHVRIMEEAFLAAWNIKITTPAENPYSTLSKMDFAKKAKYKSVNKQNPFSTKGKNLLTESTATTTTKTTKRKTPEKTIHPLIQTWANVRGIDAINIGAPIYTGKDTACARRMAKWDIPPTDEEIKTAIQTSKSKTYAFQWLEGDIAKLRLANTPTPIAPAPTTTSAFQSFGTRKAAA